MTDDTPPLSVLLQRQLATTPVGRDELREPQSGLSLPQRWLLRRLDGQATLADLAQQPGCPAVERLPRDAARLVALGLAYDVGEPGPGVSMFGPTTQMGDSALTLSLDDLAPPPPAEAARAVEAGAGRRLAWPLVVLAGVAVAGTGWWLLRAPEGPAPLAVAAAASAPNPGAAAVVALAPPAASTAASGSADDARAAASSPAAAPALPATPVLPTTLVITAPEAAATRPAAAAVVAPPPPRAVAALPIPATAPRAAVAAAGPVATPAATPAPGYGPAAGTPADGPAPPPAAGPAPAYAPASPPPGPLANPVPAAVTTATAPPAAPAPNPAPPVTVTSSGPAPAPLQPPPLRPTSTVEPVFPREALGGGAREIVLQARLTVAPNGTVTQVTFTGSNSTQRPFERAARNAFLQWRFPEGAAERTYVQSLRFREE